MRLFKSISIYSFSNIFKQGLGFFLLPVITTYLATSDNGDLSTIMAMNTLISALILMSSNGAMNLEYFRQDFGEEEYPSYVRSAIMLPLAIFGLVLILFGLFGNAIAHWLEIDLFWIYAIPFFGLMNAVPVIASSLFQAFQQPVKYSIFNISMTALELLLSLVFIVLFLWNWEGRLFAILFGRFLFTIIGIFLLFKAGVLSGRFNAKYLKNAIWFGLPLIPHMMGAIIMDFADRIFIRQMISSDELGVYDIGYKVGSIIAIVQVSIFMAWNPFLFERLKTPDKNSKIQIACFSYVLMGVMIFSALALTLFAPLLYHFFIGEAFQSGIRYVFWVALGYAFLGCYKLVGGYIFYFKKTFLLSYLSILNIAMNLTLNYFLIKAYGAIGAAYATTISYFVFFIIVFIISNRLFPIPWLAFGEIWAYGKDKAQRVFKEIFK